MQALHTAATGMAAQELSVQVISNNIANLQTTGYKKQTTQFEDLIYEHVRRVGAQASDQGTILPTGIDIGGGGKTLGTPRSMTQGTLSQTGNDLDLAINGEGFFKILMPDGTFQYTRDGTFQMDNTGRIVTAQGNPVQPTITVPQNASGLTVNAQGQVSVTLPGSTTTSTIIGQLALTRFINKAGLLAATPVTAFAQASEDAIAVPVLRATVTVESDVVRIGDVIDNAGTSAQIAIYRAPDLGTTGSLPTT